MIELPQKDNQIQCVTNFKDLISKPFEGRFNAMCLPRQLTGNFSEIVNQIELKENMYKLSVEQLHALELSQEGKLARDIILNDLNLLQLHGASPVLNVIKCYERDDSYAFFPTDVYSFHVDRSTVPTDTFLCTYYGESSDILPNAQATQKILVPEIRAELKKLYTGTEEGFDSFLTENFFDLHYQAKPAAKPINLGLGNLWKLAVDHALSQVIPCLHRAPKDKKGQNRLLLIC